MSWQQVSAMGAGGNGPGMGAGGVGQDMSGGGVPNQSNQPHATEYTLQGMIIYIEDFISFQVRITN